MVIKNYILQKKFINFLKTSILDWSNKETEKKAKKCETISGSKAS